MNVLNEHKREAYEQASISKTIIEVQRRLKMTLREQIREIILNDDSADAGRCADAIINALLRQTHTYHTSSNQIASFCKKHKGWLVFIPEGR